MRTIAATYDDPSENADPALRHKLKRVLLSCVGEPRLSVDRDECEANAVCVGIAPEVFELDDDENLILHVETPGPDLIDKVREAVNSCPKRALFLTDADS
jgi:ferredoxin